MLLGLIAVLSLLAAAGVCLALDAFAGMSWLWLLPLGFAGAYLLLALAAFVFVWFACAAVRTDVPQEKDSPFFRRLLEMLAQTAICLLHVHVQTKGLQQMPKSGRFLLVCNHLSDMDPVILAHYFRGRQLAFISKRENSSMFLVGKLMHKTMCQLINRENDREALKTILKCVDMLNRDTASIAVFPEGYTSRDHRLHHFRSGVFKIAQKAKVPIVVCTLSNTHRIFPNARHLRGTDVALHLLEVIPPEAYAGKTTVQLGEEIYDRMLEDLGADYAPEEQNG